MSLFDSLYVEKKKKKEFFRDEQKRVGRYSSAPQNLS